MRYIFLDIETTNEHLDFNIDHSTLIEIGLYDPEKGREFQSFFHYGNTLSEFTKRLTGIQDVDVNNADPQEKVFERLFDWL